MDCDPESETAEIQKSHIGRGGFLHCDPESKTGEILKSYFRGGGC